MKARNECYFCKSIEASERIYTEDYSFDEVACERHGEKLLELAKGKIPDGISRTHASSTGSLQREQGEAKTNVECVSPSLSMPILCPKCQADLDLMDIDDEGYYINAFCVHPKNLSGMYVCCPECYHEFEIGEVIW